LRAKVVLANYVVRIYRLDRENPCRIVGLVEEVGRKGKKAFTNYDELWGILNPPKVANFQRRMGPKKAQRRKEVIERS
jgi:hypothetical protein